MTPDGAAFRGHAYLSLVEPLTEDRPALFRAALARVPAETAMLLTGPLLADQWYPRRHLHALLGELAAVAGDDAPVVLREAGAMAARFQLGAIYRVLLSATSPRFVFRRMGSIWRRQSTAGEVRVEAETEALATFVLEDPACPPELPQVLAGWTETVVRLVGRTPRATKVEDLGPGAWRFTVAWVTSHTPGEKRAATPATFE